MQNDISFAADAQLVGFRTAEAAIQAALDHPETIDAVIHFDEGSEPLEGRYTIRVNHTAVPPTQASSVSAAVGPDQAYKGYWLFANLQSHLDRQEQRPCWSPPYLSFSLLANADVNNPLVPRIK